MWQNTDAMCKHARESVDNMLMGSRGQQNPCIYNRFPYAICAAAQAAKTFEEQTGHFKRRPDKQKHKEGYAETKKRQRKTEKGREGTKKETGREREREKGKNT